MKLFVGSLPFEVGDKELQELFEQYGTVSSARVIMDRDTGRSRGFGFVEMSTAEEGQQAMEQLNGSTIGSRTIVVNQARDNDRSRR